MAEKAKTIAAIDLGSNSFHLAIGRVENGQLQIVCRHREKVQLAKYLDDNSVLCEAGIARASTCLRSFRQALLKHSPLFLKIVATNTIRVAANQDILLQQIHSALGLQAQVISGEEEAGLIYQGATESLSCEQEILVLDVGGGSTELILGKGHKIKALISFPFGCVNMTQRYFSKGVSGKAFDALTDEVNGQVKKHLALFKGQSWANCLGCSGTVQSMIEVANHHRQPRSNGITVKELVMQLDALKHSGDVEQLVGLRPDRADTYAAGLGIVVAVAQALEINEINRSCGALREGVLSSLAKHPLF